MQRLGGVLLIPIYTRKLTLAEYGDYALSQTIVTLLSAVFVLGLSSSVSRFYFDGKDPSIGEARSGSVARWMTMLMCGWCLTIALGLVIFGDADGRGLLGRYAQMLLLIQTAGYSVLSPVLVYLRARQRPYTVAALQLTDFAVNTTGGIVFVVLLKRGFHGVLEAGALSAGSLGIVSIVFIWLRMRGSLSPENLRAAIRFSSPYLFQIFSNWLLSASDRWALKSAGRHDEVGSYALGGQLANLVMMPIASLSEADLPRFGEIFRAQGMKGVGQELPRTRRRYFLVSGGLSLALISTIPIIRLALGDGARAALPLIPLFCVVLMLDAQFYPNQAVVYCASRSGYLTWATLTTILVNLGALAVMTSRFGVYGALVAKGAGSLARVGMTSIAARRCLREGDRQSSPT
jgi:O-antigen/teichoic acid export membrane protein